jgi:hypothetical protein
MTRALCLYVVPIVIASVIGSFMNYAARQSGASGFQALVFGCITAGLFSFALGGLFERHYDRRSRS